MNWHNGRVGYDIPHPLGGFALGSRGDHACIDRVHVGKMVEFLWGSRRH